MPISIFISYSHRDTAMHDELLKHLKPLEYDELVSAWHDGKLLPGDDFDQEIALQLQAADIIVLLISSDFMASAYCYEKELKEAMERHSAGTARVIPVILRPTDWG